MTADYQQGFDYQLFTKSNVGIYSPELQEKISTTRIGLLGLGFGSELLRQLVQAGFQRFNLTDPDSVEVNNLNRQTYTFQQALKGLTKVEASDINARQINPQVEITPYPEGTTFQNTSQLITDSDIIIDAMDPLAAAYEAVMISDEAKKQGKIILYPIEVGFRGVSYIFTPNTASLKEFLGLEDYKGGPLTDSQMGSIVASLLKDADLFAQDLARRFLAGELKKYPQNGFTTAAIAALTGHLTVRLIGQSINCDPYPQQPIHLAPRGNIIDLNYFG